MRRNLGRVVLWRLGVGSLLAAAALLALVLVFDGFLGERTWDTRLPTMIATLVPAGILFLVAARCPQRPRCPPAEREHGRAGAPRLSQLTAAETELVRRCLLAAVHGPFFPDEEFETLFGLRRQEVAAVADAWPPDERREEVQLAIQNSMNNLLGYPHGRADAWDAHLQATVAEVERVFAKWRNPPAASPQ